MGSKNRVDATVPVAVSKAFDASDLRLIRLRTVECVLDMLRSGSLPMDEWDDDVLLPYHNGYSLWLIGRENYDAAGNLMRTGPLSAEQIVDRIEARKRTELLPALPSVPAPQATPRKEDSHE